MKQCPICGKRGMMVGKFRKLRGKYSRVPIKKRKYPNLQWVRIPLDIKKPAYKKFAGKRILACTKCIKAMAKRK
ncbi:MAG: L28 family ribosomal protein [Patescibacteria group bacterium]|nr:L28 family ribosomal protein [Patescibacteria group bacterium]